MRRRLLSASVRGGRTAAAYQRAAAAYPRTPCGHPLIDVSPLLHGGDATLTVKHLRAALEQFGYGPAEAETDGFFVTKKPEVPQ